MFEQGRSVEENDLLVRCYPRRITEQVHVPVDRYCGGVSYRLTYMDAITIAFYGGPQIARPTMEERMGEEHRRQFG